MDNAEEQLNIKQRCKYFFIYHWRGFLSVLFPIIFLPLLFIKPTMEMRCAYVVCLMAVFWIFELIPLGVTSLLPIAFFPIMGIMDTASIVKAYFPNAILLFFGSLVVALAIEYSNLHKRIAYGVLALVGCSPYRLHFSMVFITMFVSMWISNSAATAMMCPVIKGILTEMSAQGVLQMYDDSITGTDEPPAPSGPAIAFYLGVSYASSIGGLGTLIGTGTNIAFKGIFEKKFPNTSDVNFLQFMAFNVLPMLINTTLMALGLQWQFMGLFRRGSSKKLTTTKEAELAARLVIKAKAKEFGRFTLHELQVGILFILMIVLFLTQKPGMGNLKGYADVLNEKKIKSSAALIGVSILLFALPVNYLFMKYFICRKPAEEGTQRPLLDWQWFALRHSWGLLYLLAGGFALAEGADKSHFAEFVGKSLSVLQALPRWLLQLLMLIIAIIATAFTSNVAMCNILMPIMINMAIEVHVNPTYICLPVALGLSMAFHLPVSTPPNAIVSAYANIKTKDMAIGGIIPTLVVIISIFAFMQSWGLVIYPDLHKFPAWAEVGSRSE